MYENEKNFKPKQESQVVKKRNILIEVTRAIYNAITHYTNIKVR